MKLLSKTSLLIITASIFIFWIGNVVFFFLTREMISSQINSDLMTEMAGVMTRLNNAEAGGIVSAFDEISIRETDDGQMTRPVFSDTVLYNKSQQKYIAYRALTFTHRSSEVSREIIIFKSLLSSDRLIERITLMTVLLLISFIIIIFILNRYIFSNVWSNFSKSLETIDEYSFTDLNQLRLPGSEIDEFDKLNKVLQEMANRIQNDYRSLKELTANTSHEIQTPLAIIKGKAELLLQSEKLEELEMESVNSILMTVGRLSKLNQSLLLVTRIENNQFEDSERIELSSAVEKSVQNLEMLISAGNYKIVTDYNLVNIEINPVLLDVLISNLLKNALQHGEKDSEISVKVQKGILSITNPGNPLPFSSELLFSRFIKDSGNSKGTGIGLEIVRKICNYYKMKVWHSYSHKSHTFSIDFSSIETQS